MSKKLLTILLSVVAACAFAFAAACTPVVNPPEEPTEEVQLTLSLSSVQLERLEEVTLTAKYDDEIINQVIDHKESKVWEEYIEEFKKFLSIEEVEIIVDHLVFEYTFKEIAASRGVSLFAISSKYKRAIDKLKKYYERGELDV